MLVEFALLARIFPSVEHLIVLFKLNVLHIKQRRRKIFTEFRNVETCLSSLLAVTLVLTARPQVNF